MDTELASRLSAAARTGGAAQVRALLPPTGSPEEDAPADAPSGVTPLMAAATVGHEEAVEALLPRDADPALRDARGRLAAAHARAVGDSGLAKRLYTALEKDEAIR